MDQFKIKKTILRNGLTVLYCHTPRSVCFEMTMHINTGSRDEIKSQSGVSHFLEHMMFRGSQKYSDSKILAFAMEGFGGETNAMTGIENTNYWMKGNSEKILSAIECFAEFFLRPNYASLDIERDVVLQEMASDFNEEGLSVDTESLAMSTLFSDHSLGNPIIGTEEAVRNIGKEELEEKRRIFYHPLNCVLAIQTSEDEFKVIDKVTKFFDYHWDYIQDDFNLNRLSALPLIPNKNSLRKPQNALCLQNNPDNQFAIKVIFPCSGNLSKEVVRTTFLQRVLDDGICTRLPSNIREKYGLVYDISCDSQFFEDIGTFSIDVTVSEDYLSDVLDKLAKELSLILKEIPTIEEIEHIKYRYIFDLKQVQETPSRLLSRKVTEIFMKSDFSIDDEIAYVRAISNNVIFETAQEILKSTRRAFVLVGPKARKKRDLVEKFLSYFD
jgi:predicted Zn-dependent peptidase